MGGRAVSFDRRDQRVTVEVLSVTTDDQGSTVKAWSPVATVWAQVTQADGKEQADGNARSGSTSMTFEVRHQEVLRAMSQTSRVIWGGFAYDVTAVEPMPPGRPSAIKISAVLTK